MTPRPSQNAYHPSTVAPSDTETKQVETIMARLRPDERRCLRLREWDGLTLDEMSTVIGQSRSDVKRLLYRARDSFRLLWREQHREPTAEAPGTASVPTWLPTQSARS